MKNCYLLETKLTKIFFEMEERGIRVDPIYVMKAIEHESGLRDNTLSEIESEIEEKFVDSPTFLKKMFTSRGVELPKTAKGNVSTSFETFKQISDPLTPKIIRLRDYEKRIGTYYQAFLRGLDSYNRIHANIRQAGTKTGRLSYTAPNLQNIPKEDEDLDKKFVVRGSFIPTESFKFVSFDYDQVEYKIMLDYAGEKPLIARVMDGEDLHQATADMMGVTRKKAKTINFSVLYGAGSQLLADNLGVSVQEAQDLKRLYFDRLPSVKYFIKQVMRAGEYRGWVKNWNGRVYRINSRDFAYTIPNHLIQGSASEVIKIAMVNIHTLLERTRSGMLVQIHDDILHEVCESELDLIPKIKAIMESVYKPFNGMELTVTPEISKHSWAYRDFTACESHSLSENALRPYEDSP